MANDGDTAMAEEADTLDEEGRAPMPEKVEAILSAVGQMRDILDSADATRVEPSGADGDLIDALVAIAEDGMPEAGTEDGDEEWAADFLEGTWTEDGGDTAVEDGPAAPSVTSGLYVVFEAGGRAMAIDVAHVAWLDVVEKATLSDDSVPTAKVRGEMIPLCAAGGGPMTGLGDGKPVVVLIDGDRRIGLVVDEVIDVCADPDGRLGMPVGRVGPGDFPEK